MKPVVLSESQWHLLKERLRQDHPLSVLMIRSKMRGVLGFTPRSKKTSVGDFMLRREIHLDFFDESKRTFFLLKYGDYITE